MSAGRPFVSARRVASGQETVMSYDSTGSAIAQE